MCITCLRVVYSDLEVQFTSSGDHWRCDSPLCQSVNGDILHIDMGVQSILEPRQLRLVLVNTNPVPVSAVIFIIR